MTRITGHTLAARRALLPAEVMSREVSKPTIATPWSGASPKLFAKANATCSPIQIRLTVIPGVALERMPSRDTCPALRPRSGHRRSRVFANQIDQDFAALVFEALVYFVRMGLG